MTQLTGLAVAAAAYAGGFRGNTVGEAVAVAYAESSWNTTSANSCCHGLWQINTQAHPTMKTNVYDPIQNAKYAYQIYQAAGGWCTSGKPPNCNPWQGYGNSNYKGAVQKSMAAMLALQAALQQGKKPEDLVKSNVDVGHPDPLGAGIVGDAIDQTLAPAKAIIDAFNRMGGWITNPDNLTRIFKVIAGGLIILVGGAALMDKQISSVLPAGKALKLAKGVVA